MRSTPKAHPNGDVCSKDSIYSGNQSVLDGRVLTKRGNYPSFSPRTILSIGMTVYGDAANVDFRSLNSVISLQLNNRMKQTGLIKSNACGML